MQKRNRSQRNHPAKLAERIAPEAVGIIAREVGPVVYFARTADGCVKIGYSAHIGSRLGSFGGYGSLLALMPGDRRTERTEHQRFAAMLAHHREYFRPAPAIFDRIDQIRAGYGLSPCPRWE